MLVETEPADRAVNAAPSQAIRLRFDEPIGDRVGQDLPNLILVNPGTPEFDIRLDGETITLTPQEPMADGVTYMVTVLPGLADRGGNATSRARTILFAVGGETPITLSIVRATIVQDSVPAALARYHLAALDHDFDYTAVADSQGRVEMEGVAYGRYEATAWIERTRPQGWQLTEEPGARDTFALSVDRRAHEATYRIAVVDTTAPLVLSVATPESRSLRIALDDALAPGAELGPSSIRLWEAEADVDVDAPLDSLDPARLRTRRLAISAVEAQGARELRAVPAEPLSKLRVYRLELRIENASGLAATPEGGRTFRPRYDGPAVWPSERIPWPAGGEAPEESVPGQDPPPAGAVLEDSR